MEALVLEQKKKFSQVLESREGNAEKGHLRTVLLTSNYKEMSYRRRKNDQKIKTPPNQAPHTGARRDQYVSN